MLSHQDVSEFIDNVIASTPILETAGTVVKLSRVRKPSGFCPFHHDEKRSFIVYPEQNRWRCDECGRSGSAISFLADSTGITFWEAVTQLATRLGIAIPPFSEQDVKAATRDEQISAFLAQYSAECHKTLLANPQALEYCTSIGISKDSIREYQIGYGVRVSPSSSKQTGISPGEAGLIIGHGSRACQPLEGKLVFPITHNGRVVQIAGRTISKQEPAEYVSLVRPPFPMNSHQLKGKQCVLAENPIDLVSLEQAGIAAAATILADFQRGWLRLLDRQTRYVLAYGEHGYDPGEQPVDKVGKLLYTTGYVVSILNDCNQISHARTISTERLQKKRQGGRRRTSFERQQQTEFLTDLVAEAKPYMDYFIERLPSSPPPEELEGILLQCYERLQHIDAGARAHYFDTLASRYSIPKADIRSGLRDYMKVHRSRTTAAATDEVPDAALPVIDADCQDLRSVSAQAWDALVAANAPPRYFRRGGVPVRLERSDSGALMPCRLTIDKMRYELARAAHWTSRKGGKKTGSKPPWDVVRDCLAHADVPFPVLDRIIDVPVFAPDGSLQMRPGYHKASRVFYEPAAGMHIPHVPKDPGDDDTAKALAIFKDVVADFPFQEESDLAHALALFLLPFVRDLIPGPTPLHIIESPSPGCGKGLLMDCLVIPSVGTHIGSVTQAEDDKEWRKRLTTQLLKAQPIIMIDNVTKPLDSAILSSALARPVWEDRILGGNDGRDLPIRCVWVATANNPTMSTEIARRSIRIRIDPQVDRPWLRDGFRHQDLTSHVLENRGEIVWAALVLVQTWIARGMTLYHGKPLGTYEQWSRVLGGICECAGVGGFLKSLSDFYEIADVEGTKWRRFVQMWYEKHGSAPVGVAELFHLATRSDLFDLGSGSERSRRTVFGKELGRQRDRVIGDYRIVQAGTKHRVARWRLLPARDLLHEQVETKSPTSLSEPSEHTPRD